MKCFYHSADLDGQCSGAIVKMQYPGCELIGINYGDFFPWDRIDGGETVFMVDFTLQPFDDMERLNTICHLVWIDHHETAIKESQKRGFKSSGGGRQVEGLAGCELTWDYIMHQRKIPSSVRLLGRYDVWDHFQHPGSLEFQYGMKNERADPNDRKFWEEVFYDDEFVINTIKTGKLLLDYEKKQNEKYCKAFSFDTELDGLRCLAVNKGMTSSQLFESIWNTDKYDAMLSFIYKKGQWTISLYSDKPSINVGDVCKVRGGGGHKGAAGFQCRVLPFKGAKQ